MSENNSIFFQRFKIGSNRPTGNHGWFLRSLLSFHHCKPEIPVSFFTNCKTGRICDFSL